MRLQIKTLIFAGSDLRLIWTLVSDYMILLFSLSTEKRKLFAPVNIMSYQKRQQKSILCLNGTHQLLPSNRELLTNIDQKWLFKNTHCLFVFMFANASNKKADTAINYELVLKTPGDTQIWFGRECAARALKPIHIFKCHFGQKDIHL